MRGSSSNIKRRLDPFPSKKSLVIFLLLFCFLYLGACDSTSSQGERDLKGVLRRLNHLRHNYDKIPVKKKQQGTAFIIWKDKKQLKSFYEEYQNEFKSIDNTLFKIINMRDEKVWYDDAIFCRSILYLLWTRVDPDDELVKKAIDVSGHYVDLSFNYNIEKRTKTALRESFWNKYKDVISADLSYEENARMIFQSYIAYLLLKLENYKAAIEQYELVAKTYRGTKLSEYAKKQVNGIKDVLEGRITIPEISPQ